MTLNLFILRHAQSPMIRGDDFDRPLSDKGLADMKLLADIMTKRGFAPSYCHCSPANRTRQTLRMLTQNGLDGLKIDSPENLYNGPAGTLYQAIKSTDNSHKSAMIVAHNPGVYDLAVFLTKPDQYGALCTGYKPGTLTALQFDCENWADVMPNSGAVQDVIIPTD